MKTIREGESGVEASRFPTAPTNESHPPHADECELLPCTCGADDCDGWALELRLSRYRVVNGVTERECHLAHYRGSLTEDDGRRRYHLANASIDPPTTNEHLIGAAPDLLAACKLALETAGALVGATRRGKIRDAIAKAEGR